MTLKRWKIKKNSDFPSFQNTIERMTFANSPRRLKIWKMSQIISWSRIWLMLKMRLTPWLRKLQSFWMHKSKNGFNKSNWLKSKFKKAIYLLYNCFHFTSILPNNKSFLTIVCFIFLRVVQSLDSRPKPFIFKTNVGKSRIRHITTLNLNDVMFNRFWVD